MRCFLPRGQPQAIPEEVTDQLPLEKGKTMEDSSRRQTGGQWAEKKEKHSMVRMHIGMEGSRTAKS
jgi:hypothetical protein